MYQYNAKLVKVIDGDTIDANIDLGFGIAHTIRVRLSGINTTELRSKVETDRILAQKAKSRVIELIGQKGSDGFVVHTFKDSQEKYGRYLAKVVFADGTSLNDTLLTEGLAVPY